MLKRIAPSRLAVAQPRRSAVTPLPLACRCELLPPCGCVSAPAHRHRPGLLPDPPPLPRCTLRNAASYVSTAQRRGQIRRLHPRRIASTWICLLAPYAISVQRDDRPRTRFALPRKDRSLPGCVCPAMLRWRHSKLRLYYGFASAECWRRKRSHPVAVAGRLPSEIAFGRLPSPLRTRRSTRWAADTADPVPRTR